MKNLLAIITLSLILFTPIVAQTDVKSACPQLSITGPAGVFNPGEVATYIAEIDSPDDSLNIEYVWSVSSGRIISGQGTRTVKVEQPGSEASGSNLTATVEVKGFPEGCPTTASESIIICFPEGAVKLDEFYDALTVGNHSTLDNIIAAMR
ncbi:MAG: hypothetical protein WKF92_14190 [Pyrinomonadaceae bacterium]